MQKQAQKTALQKAHQQQLTQQKQAVVQVQENAEKLKTANRERAEALFSFAKNAKKFKRATNHKK